MVKNRRVICLFPCLTLLLLIPVGKSFAHFGMIIPSDSMVMHGEDRSITLTLSFSHPFEGIGMELVKPAALTLFKDGKRQDLAPELAKAKVMDHLAWKLDYTIRRPGAYAFVMEPVPYWEPAEDCYIVHYTKTVVTAFGNDEGWDDEIGLKTEIVPLVRPFGNYAGNIFTGKVLVDNTPMAGIDVEVELYNQEGWVAPTDSHITQVVKTDDNGNFSFTCPLPGWWGFSALTDAEYSLKSDDGEEKKVELGAVIWVYFDPNPFLGR